MTRHLIAMVLTCAAAACGGGVDLDPDEHLPGGDTTNTFLFGSNALTPPAANITADHEAMFFTGNSFFNQGWVQAPSSTQSRDGLGPTFNARSCSACHFKDGRGRPPVAPDEAFLGMLLRLSIDGVGPEGAPVGDPTYGGQLQPFSILDVPAEGTPSVSYEELPGTYDDGTPYSLRRPTYAIDDWAFGDPAPDLRVSPRVAPAMIGLGLLEAIATDELEALADPDDADGDGISGRLNRVWDVARQAVVIGRFGWKAEQPSVRQQSAGAFLGDIGITSSLFPEQDCPAAQTECLAAQAGGDPEIPDDLLDRVEVYAQLVSVPARQDYDTDGVLHGKALFAEARCDSCHVPRYVTGRVDALPEVSEQVIFPYTDLLLHDMGDELSDHRPSFAAEGNEWRTPPLWGLRFYPAVNGHDLLLHDGRARGVAEAILWHGGEAVQSRDAFRAMSADDRAALIRFVESL